MTHNKIKLKQKKTYWSWLIHAKPLDLRVLCHKLVVKCNWSRRQQPLLAITVHELQGYMNPWSMRYVFIFDGSNVDLTWSSIYQNFVYCGFSCSARQSAQMYVFNSPTRNVKTIMMRKSSSLYFASINPRDRLN